MENKHRDRCEAPICAEEITEEEMESLVWYPGEPMCGKRPMTKWQRIQARINRYVAKGVFKHLEYYWTANMLKVRKAIKRAKGGDPEREV